MFEIGSNQAIAYGETHLRLTRFFSFILYISKRGEYRHSVWLCALFSLSHWYRPTMGDIQEEMRVYFYLHMVQMFILQLISRNAISGHLQTRLKSLTPDCA